MGDEEEVVRYAYEGARAAGATAEVTAGEEPKVLTKTVELLGLREGEGSATFPNKDLYVGSYLNGKRDGFGTYTYAAPPPAEDEEPKPPVATYEGQWKAGVKCGVGKMTYSSGEMYHGSFAGGQRAGQGTLYYANGDFFCGEWKAGSKNGQGTYHFKASGAACSGTWKANKFVSGKFADKYSNEYAGKFLSTAANAVGFDASGKFSLASGATTPALPTKRLVLVASDTPDKTDFLEALLPSVTPFEYDMETASAADLVSLIAKAVAYNGGKFASAALANHGDDATMPGFAWPISKKVAVKSAGALGADAKAVLSALGDAVVDGGRVDLFACALLATVEGRKVFEEVQKMTTSHFAASDDLTGSLVSGGDWVMESDGVDIKELYFGNTSKFEGTFNKRPAVPTEGFTTKELAMNLSEGGYVILDGRPCLLHTKYQYGDTYKFQGTEIFTSRNTMVEGLKTKHEAKMIKNDDEMFVPLVKTTWWKVTKIEADEKTPFMPDVHDSILLENSSQMVFNEGLPPGHLKLHALGKNAMMFIDTITELMAAGNTVELKVLSACGEFEIIMKDFLRDIKYTK